MTSSMYHVPQKVLWRTFPIDLMKSSCCEGKSLSLKVCYSVILEPNRTYVQEFMHKRER